MSGFPEWAEEALDRNRLKGEDAVREMDRCLGDMEQYVRQARLALQLGEHLPTGTDITSVASRFMHADAERVGAAWAVKELEHHKKAAAR